ncbi:MAG: hypothetical protein R3357_15125 [Burkholderiales bacterium]|nr:hypothetical protein [Burkholderiales bacterium]
MPNLVYRFQFPDGHEESLQVTASAAGDARAKPPGWAALEFQQCSNCPLSPSATPHCPMALRLVPLVDLFGKVRSYEEVTARVESEERTVTKRTTVQRVLRSLMGLLSATSDCPHVAFLKPMAHFHLPFSSAEETVYRVASTYLLAQYFRRQQGLPADAGLEGLKAHYHALQQVNAAMARRLAEISAHDSERNGDSHVNALVLLDVFAQSLPDSIDAQLEELRPAFQNLAQASAD